ncbi:hypothetical protein J6590_004785 [Homalodisca vitripennis]|nr:hypothetical protein J6590_004785 [Homalodisca vitripennis]
MLNRVVPGRKRMSHVYHIAAQYTVQGAVGETCSCADPPPSHHPPPAACSHTNLHCLSWELDNSRFS